jgi:hypothetical protein
MEDEYLTDFSNFFEKINKKNTTIEDINKLCDAHEKRVEFMQKLIKNNKKLLTEFWQKKFPENASIDNILPRELQEK